MTSGILCPFVATCFGSSRACFNWKYMCSKRASPPSNFFRWNVKFFPFELKKNFTAEHSYNWRHWYVFGLSDWSEIFFSFIVKPVFPVFAPKCDRTDFFLRSVVFALINWGFTLWRWIKSPPSQIILVFERTNNLLKRMISFRTDKVMPLWIFT